MAKSCCVEFPQSRAKQQIFAVTKHEWSDDDCVEELLITRNALLLLSDDSGFHQSL